MSELDKKLGDIDVEDQGLAHGIVRSLVQAILDRTLKGGDRLVETELQKHFKVSRSPLREALKDLESKGLVVRKPRRGTFVKTITRKDIDEHYPVQASLEGLAAKTALKYITQEDCAKMSQHLEGLDKAAEAQNTKAFLKSHEAFHTVYIEACGNQLLIDMINELRFRGTRFRYFFLHTPEYYQYSINVHHKIRDQLCDPNTDPAQLEETVREHIECLIDMDGWEL